MLNDAVPTPPENSAEPVASIWHGVSAEGLMGRLGLPPRMTGNRVVLVDGRSAGGKTTLAERLHTALAGSVVVHTDDIAWDYSFFDWDTDLIENVIAPVRRNESVRYRPPGWSPTGPDRTIVVEAGRDLIVEGVGAGRANLAAWADAVIWVQSDFQTARVRGLARDLANGREAAEIELFWDEWMTAELSFLEAEQPWRHATVFVPGQCTGNGIEIATVPEPQGRRIGEP